MSRRPFLVCQDCGFQTRSAKALFWHYVRVHKLSFDIAYSEVGQELISHGIG
jgi:hypothetical protein